MQIIIESPYDEYIAKLIENGEFQNAEQVVKFALKEKFQFDQWDDQTISLIEEGLKDVEEGTLIDITDVYQKSDGRCKKEIPR
ncbi:MAG: hypothetical protein IPN46_09475 [Saprospiraceae bacterium]|nr:hypothetical protein [Saprospiraceae bacterium]